MANYCASARSNYFKVKDETAFRKWCDLWGLGIFESKEHPGMFALGATGGSGDGWPSYRFDEQTEDDVEWVAEDEVSQHLADGQVAILMEAGAEKLRYISAYARAIHSNGEMVSVSLNDIYAKAQDAFPDAAITQAIY